MHLSFEKANVAYQRKFNKRENHKGDYREEKRSCSDIGNRNWNRCKLLFAGEVTGAGTGEATISDCRGGVYGFFIEFKNEEEFKSFNDEARGKKYIKEKVLGDWKAAIGSYYPLYWGKDINLGARLKAHTKSFKSTCTIQMSDRKKLINHKIIFGAMLCNDYDEIEKNLHDKYPDIYKTTCSENAEEAHYNEELPNEESNWCDDDD